MKPIRLSLNPSMFVEAGQAMLTVFATTLGLLAIGRATLGEAVIALLYLIPVGWSASRWGPAPGISAAMTGAFCFDFFFIPPFLTFTVGSLEGWLVLAIFLAVAVLVVGRIQSGLARAQASEREAIFMYELSAALAGMRAQAAVAHNMAWQLRQMFQAERVKVLIHAPDQAASVVAQEPAEAQVTRRPDRVLPILNAWGLVGEIQVWRGAVELPSAEGRLLRNFASQAGQALERTRLAEIEEQGRGVRVSAPDPTTIAN